MRFEQTFQVAASPEAVFDYMTDPAKLTSWQTTKTAVIPVGDEPVGRGSRIRERTKPPGGREFEQVVEFSEFERPRLLRTHIVDGPQPIDGTWELEPVAANGGADGTRVRFVAEGDLRGPLRFLGPLARMAMDRQFARYHEQLRRNVERA